MIQNIVIVAGGLGSRLAPLTNFIPKFLVNIGKETGFVEQIRYWKKYHPQSITVIVHSAYKDLVKAYYDMYFAGDEDLQVLKFATTPLDNDEIVPMPFHVKTVDSADGSAHAIMETCDHLIGQSVIFQWCDVMPAVDINEESLYTHSAVVFTNYDHQNRYGLKQFGQAWSQVRPEPTPDGSGGVFGMYYVSRFKKLPYVIGQDFVEIIEQYGDGKVSEVTVSKIVDWGDKPKLEWTRSKADKARSFNAVEFHGELVLKRGLNEQGAKLMQREMAWYDELNTRQSKLNRPKVWIADDSFVMTKVKDSVSVYEHWPILDDEGRREVLSRVIGQLHHLHDTAKLDVDPMVVRRDVKAEAYDKLISRYREIQHVIKAFGPITNVNGYDFGGVPDAEELISKTWQKLDAKYRDVTQYSLIHGDLQFSNSMVNQGTHEITFIDPRGYFGGTNLFGLPDYDFSKLLYALSGYDLFNYSHDFHISRLSEGSIEFDVPTPNCQGIAKLYDETFTDTHRLWLAVIWQGLAQYIKNDPVKSVAAHYHGLVMMHQLTK